MNAVKALLAVMLLVAPLRAELPRPLAEHPGNIFLEGEVIALPAPMDGYQWVDFEGNEVAKKTKLPVGYYEARSGDGRRVSFAVIAPLQAKTPATSPIGIDVAMAWFYKTEAQQRAAANLCQLAGINWVRDRMNWGDLEPRRGTFAKHNIYDDTARIQSEVGLRVLQVNHISPPWANPDAKRFPIDLRDAYRFNREMARRWKGQVLAIEPWNEADISVFGGHTGSEMASMQKASYLGIKAGNTQMIVCQNVFAIARQTTLDDFAANDASGYFDTYNLHHYVGFDKYPQHYAAHRAVSAGKPIWVSECNIPVDWADEKTKEPNDESLRWQANRVAKIFAMSLHEGSVNTIYFMLPHYVEHKRQYGILHEDLTPRPAYVALAAVGRLLADGKPLGRMVKNDAGVHGYLVRAMPDGQEKIVLVAWSDKPCELQLNAPVERLFDQLGRERKGSWVGQLKLSPAPTFAIMPADLQPALALDRPAAAPARAPAKELSPLVLQVHAAPELVDLQQSAYALAPDRNHEIIVRVYNFGAKMITEPLLVHAPPRDWTIRLPEKVTLMADEMKEIKVQIDARPASAKAQAIHITAGAATLSLRIVDEKSPEKPAK